MSFDNAYEALTEEQTDGDARWAFGTGFDDPLKVRDDTVPKGVDGADLAAYCRMLGDDSLVLSQRLIEWVTEAPELEDEVALANIALDLLGQARLLLTRSGQADHSGRGEDDLAFFRSEREFCNVRLVEMPNGDFAETVARLLVFSAWRLVAWQRLAESRDPVLAAIAAKAIKEVTYHRDYAARWVVRLGDGTKLSRSRMRSGLQAVWPMVDELFTTHAVDRRTSEAGIGIDPSELRGEFDAVMAQVLETATLERPEAPPMSTVAGEAGRDGMHTEHFGFLIAEMQSLARAHPEATW